jgi:hypothetical protein
LKLLKSIISFILPKKIFNFLAFLYGYKFFKISYSQFGEDLIILKYLQYKKITKGIYLDIGAFHPRWISNTHLLHKLGFEGMCVDLDEEKLKYFKFARGNKVKTICASVSTSKKKYLNFYKFKRKHQFSEIDTLSYEFANKIKKKWKINFEIKKIKNYYINDLFTKIGKINILNIDVEGLDYKLIKHADFKIIDPDIIIFEDARKYFASKEIVNYFCKMKYNLLFQSGPSKCFAKN